MSLDGVERQSVGDAFLSYLFPVPTATPIIIGTITQQQQQEKMTPSAIVTDTPNIFFPWDAWSCG